VDFFRVELVAQPLRLSVRNAAAEPALPDGQRQKVSENQNENCYT